MASRASRALRSSSWSAASLVLLLGPLVGLGGEGVFLGGEVAELLAVEVELGQGVEPAADLVEPVAEGAEAGVGLAKLDEPLGGVGGLAGLVELGPAGLGLDLGGLAGGAGERAEGRVVLEVAGEELELVLDGSGLDLAGGEVGVPAGVPGLRRCAGRRRRRSGAARSRGGWRRWPLRISSSLAWNDSRRSRSSLAIIGSALAVMAIDRASDHVSFGPLGAGRLSRTRTR